MKFCVLFALALFATGTVRAQSSPNLVYGQVPSAAQWNSYFQAKQDYLSVPPNSLLGNSAAGSVSGQNYLSVPNCNGVLSGLQWTTNAGFSCGTYTFSGALVLISTQTANNIAASIAWTQLGTTYTNYKLICSGLTPAVTDNINLVVGTGSGPTYVTSNYINAYSTVNSTATVAGGGTSTTSFLSLDSGHTVAGSPLGTGDFPGASFDVTLYNVPATSAQLQLTVTGTGWSVAPSNYYGYTIGGAYNGGGTTNRTAIKVYTAGGNNFSAGVCSLYGIAN